MLRNNIVFIIGFFCLFQFSVFGQTNSYSNEFLSIGAGARAFAMGKSNVASVNDVTAAYWNTAALILLPKKYNAGLMHAHYFSGLAQYNFASFAFIPKPKRGSYTRQSKYAYAISFVRFGVDNIPNTTQLVDENGQLRFDRIRSFSVADYAIFLSYAYHLPIKGLSVGGNLKVIHRVSGEFARAWGFGIDLSALYTMKEWKFGLMLRDITTTFNTWAFTTKDLKKVFDMTGNTLPKNSTEITLPKIILGMAYEKIIQQKFGILAEINLDISTDGKRNTLISTKPLSIDPHLGVEVNYNDMIFVRAGIENIQKEPKGYQKKMIYTLQPNIGLGIKYKHISIDYALSNLGNLSIGGYSHIISVGYAMDNVKSKKR